MCSKLSLQVGTCIVCQVTIKVHYTGVPCVQLGANYLCSGIQPDQITFSDMIILGEVQLDQDFCMAI